jgi:hypothetical protein
MTDNEYDEWRQLTDEMIEKLPFENEMTHVDSIVDFRDKLLLKFKQRLEAGQHETLVICQFLKKMADKHGVEIDDLNIHTTHGQIHIQKYSPGELHEFKCLETLDMEGI